MTGANVLKRVHNIEMNEALKESLLLKTTHKPGRQGPGMCLELMMENSFRKLLSAKKRGEKKKKKPLETNAKVDLFNNCSPFFFPAMDERENRRQPKTKTTTRKKNPQ